MVVKMNKLSKYLKIYKQLIKFAAITETTYRFSFILEIFVELAYTAMVVLGIRVIYWNISEIGGWDYNQLLVLLGVSTLFNEILLGTAFVFNLRRLPEKIKNGDLDYILTKPLNSNHGFLTANDVTAYGWGSIDLSEGPVIIEVPAATDKVSYFGSILNAWQQPLEDIGPAGADKGKGGK